MIGGVSRSFQVVNEMEVFSPKSSKWLRVDKKISPGRCGLAMTYFEPPPAPPPTQVLADATAASLETSNAHAAVAPRDADSDTSVLVAGGVATPDVLAAATPAYNSTGPVAEDVAACRNVASSDTAIDVAAAGAPAGSDAFASALELADTITGDVTSFDHATATASTDAAQEAAESIPETANFLAFSLALAPADATKADGTASIPEAVHGFASLTTSFSTDAAQEASDASATAAAQTDAPAVAGRPSLQDYAMQSRARLLRKTTVES